MGKSVAGALWLDAGMTSPFDFYQYFVNVDDRDVARFLALLTFLPMDEVRRLGALQGADLRSAKETLALEVTTIVHGREAADTARQAARAAFGAGASVGVADDANVPSVKVAAGDRLVDVLAASGLAASKSIARRLIEQGGVRIGKSLVADVAATIAPADLGLLLHVGKKHIRKLVGG